MLSLAEKGYKELKVASDQIEAPTYTYNLARLLVDMIETENIRPLSCDERRRSISLGPFLRKKFRRAGKDVKGESRDDGGIRYFKSKKAV